MNVWKALFLVRALRVRARPGSGLLTFRRTYTKSSIQFCFCYVLLAIRVTCCSYRSVSEQDDTYTLLSKSPSDVSEVHTHCLYDFTCEFQCQSAAVP